MRKILSVVLAVLMVSMIIPTMSFAAAAGIEDITGLVAGETFTVTPNSDATISVNTQVFDIVDGVEDGAIESIAVTAGTAVSIKVKTSVPVEFTSQIKVNAEFVNVSIKDRLIGDANGDGAVDALDGNQLLRYDAGLSVVESFNEYAANANGDDAIDALDGNQLLRYDAGLSTVNANLGVAYLGGNATFEVADPWTAEPEVKKLDAPTGVYAYHQNGKVYFTFNSVVSATSYDVKVGDGEAKDFTTTSGSIDATYAEGLTISVVAKAEGFDPSDATTENVVDATVSGELAKWLDANGLSDVAITVYEITE